MEGGVDCKDVGGVFLGSYYCLEFAVSIKCLAERKL